MNIKRSLKRVGRSASKRYPQILLGFSIAGVVITAVTASNDTLKAELILDELKEKMDEAEEQQLPKEDMNDIRKHYAWELTKCYWRTLVAGSLTITTMVLSHRGMRKQQAFFISVANMAQHSLFEYREAVSETLKPKQVEEVEKRVYEKEVERRERLPIYDKRKGSEAEIIETGKGDQLFLDKTTGFMFRSNPTWIKNACIGLSQDLLKTNEMEQSLNDYCEHMHLPRGTAYERMGWRIEQVAFSIEPRIVYRTWYNEMKGEDEPIGVIELDPKPEVIW